MATLVQAQELFFAALDAQNLKQFDIAERLYREALALAPDRPSLLNNLAAVLQQQGNFTEALACCERLISISPDDASTMNNYGNALAAMGRHDEALQQFDLSLQITPDFPDALASRGNLLLRRHVVTRCARCLRL